MFEGLINSTDPLPLALQSRWDLLKQQCEQTAQIYREAGLTRHAQRLETCCDRLTFYQFRSGYLRFKSAYFCRVRGCPICEQIISNEVKHHLRLADRSCQKKQPKDRWITFNLTTPPIDIDNFRSLWSQLQLAWQRFNQRKAWNLPVWLRQTKLINRSNLLVIEVKIIALTPQDLIAPIFFAIQKQKLIVRSLQISSSQSCFKAKIFVS